MLLTYKTSIPTTEVAQRIVTTLNKLESVEATSDFIMVIPRHQMITITLPDNSSNQGILEIGALCGALDY